MVHHRLQYIYLSSLGTYYRHIWGGGGGTLLIQHARLMQHCCIRWAAVIFFSLVRRIIMKKKFKHIFFRGYKGDLRLWIFPFLLQECILQINFFPPKVVQKGHLIFRKQKTFFLIQYVAIFRASEGDSCLWSLVFHCCTPEGLQYKLSITSKKPHLYGILYPWRI